MRERRWIPACAGTTNADARKTLGRLGFWFAHLRPSHIAKMNVAPPVEPSNAEVMDADVVDAEVMEAAEQPEWCWRPDCCRTGPGGAHLSRPAKVHSALTAL